jgi:hypothetical protein
MTEKEKYEKLLQRAQLVDPNVQINFVMLDLQPRWMKCRRTRRLVFQFHKLGQEEGFDCLREKARKVSNPPRKAGKPGDHAGEHDVRRAWSLGFL